MKKKRKCDACDNKGWLLVNKGNDKNLKLTIERCDVCKQFADDNAAVVYVASLAQKREGQNYGKRKEISHKRAKL